MTKRHLTIFVTGIFVMTGMLFGFGSQADRSSQQWGQSLRALVSGGPPAAVAATRSATLMVPVSFTDLAEKSKAGVVNIRTVKSDKEGGPVFRHFFGRNPFRREDPFRDFFGGPQREFKQRSLGSGFLIDAKGFIVTNNHVVENADQIKVRLYDETEYDAKVVGRDPKTDIALIKI